MKVTLDVTMLVIIIICSIGLGLVIMATVSVFRIQDARKEAYYKGIRDIGGSIHSLHFWFNNPKYPQQVPNILFLISDQLIKYASVQSYERIREAIEKWGGSPYYKLDEEDVKRFL
jgi:archaellum component FlaF (FlaF/FlaG flagellin family)